MHPPQGSACPPITADDATIEQALRDANIPALLNALVHITGDLDLIRGAVKVDTSFLADAQGGVPEAEQARVRKLALDVLRKYRDAGSPPPKALSSDVTHEMLNFIAGGEVPANYVEFLEGELAINEEDAFGPPSLASIPKSATEKFRVVVIGAGMSGLLAAIRLQEAGLPYVILEKNADVGGTWFENTYPGCRVDSANHTYSYSFEPNDWPQHFSQQKVLREYFTHCSKKYGLRDHIRFQTEVVLSEWDQKRALWRIHVKTPEGKNETLEANAIISAVGQLNRPQFPDIPGRQRFKGPSFHSARWEHEHPIVGKKIIVIGTGASAFQFVPEIAKVATDVTVFQRTPPWIVPNPDYHADIPPGKHWLLRYVPYYASWFRFSWVWKSAEGMLSFVKVDPKWHNQPYSVSEQNEVLRNMLLENMKLLIGDKQELYDKSIPSYPPGGKRMLIDNGNWLQTLRRDNVHLV